MHLIWHSRWGRRRNYPWQIFCWSVKGCRFCGGSKIALSHWQSQWPLTQVWRYRAACDQSVSECVQIFITHTESERPTHAGCIAAGVGRAFRLVCLFVRALTGKRPELSTPNLVHIYSIAVARHALNQRSKGQGHMVTKTVTVAWLLGSRAATDYAGMGAHVDLTACVFQL